MCLGAVLRAFGIWSSVDKSGSFCDSGFYYSLVRKSEYIVIAQSILGLLKSLVRLRDWRGGVVIFMSVSHHLSVWELDHLPPNLKTPPPIT